MAEQSQPAGSSGNDGTAARPWAERGRPGEGAQEGPGTRTRPAPAPNSAWVNGGVTFAGVLMFVNGVLAVLQGIAAIAEDEIYARVGGYIYRINLTGWGWTLLVLGTLAAVAGAGILTGAVWGRMTGIMLASLSLVVQFLFLPYQPIWSFVMIAIDVFVIWALSVYHPGGAARS